MPYIAGTRSVTFTSTLEGTEGPKSFETGDVFYTGPRPWECHIAYSGCMSLETQARILGFKNYNCYSRFIRRQKRRAEHERRRRLKEGSFHA